MVGGKYFVYKNYADCDFINGQTLIDQKNDPTSGQNLINLSYI